jgi:transposase InsO family protein
MGLSTVSGILTQIGLGKLGRLGLEPAQRYERQVPGELIHIDVKKLGRIYQGAGHRVHGKRGRYTRSRTDTEGRVRRTAGWDFVHVAIDDATRLAYVEVLRDEKALTAIAFLSRAIAHYDSYGITVEQLITDNGSAYRSSVHAIACRALGIRHLRTRPYRPQTNGKGREVHPNDARRLGLRRSTVTAANAPPHSPAGSTSTIAEDPTALSATQAAHRSPQRAEQPPRVLLLAQPLEHA